MLFVAVYGDHGYNALKRGEADEQRLMQAVKAGQQRNQALQEEIQRLRDDPTTIEKIAREELGLVKAGDVIIKLPESTPGPAPR